MTPSPDQQTNSFTPLRILEVITPSRIGGAETHVTNLVTGLTALGDSVTVFCPEDRPLVGYLKERGIIPVTWKTWGKVDPRTLWRLIHLIKKNRIDVVHTHLTTASFLGSLAARLTHRCCVATMHGLSSPFWYRYSPSFIAVSQAVKNHLVEYGFPAEKIHVIHNGIPVSQYQPVLATAAKMAAGFDPTAPMVGIVGRLSAEKGHEILFQAWCEIVGRFLGAKLLVIGTGSQEKALHALADQLNINHSVIFTGFLQNPQDMMSACDLIVVPSLSEGLGIAALEAMALCRPVIASDVGGLAEIVKDGDNGMLVQAGDYYLLRDVISALLDNPTRRENMGAAGRAYVEEYFNADKQFRIIHDFLLAQKLLQ